MDSMDPTERIVLAFQNMVSSAEWRMTLDQFLEAMEAREDDYWRDKFLDFKDLAKAVNNFDSQTLAKVIRYNELLNLKHELPLCSVCGGETEHNWETHVAEMRAH